ncbi:HPr kinase/phosphorylase [candidate division KSB1 bacterium]|nr:HPr kinase/phosphorylase [candidate division KSB1 bacterium]
MGLTVDTFWRDNRHRLKLRLVAGEKGLRRKIVTKELHRPGLALAGFFDLFTYDRVQVLGNSEILYLKKHDAAEKRRIFEKFFRFQIPCLIITSRSRPPKELVGMADEKGVPIFRTPLVTTELVHLLSDYLDDRFAPSTTVHGTLVDVYGTGILFTGQSGIGKSEIALDLVERGHRLVSDDVVTITRKAEGVLIGSGSEMLKHFMEIRGIGIINVQRIFGIRAIRLHKRVETEVELEEYRDDLDYERIGLDEQYREILGVKIPLIKLPIFPGKNITVIAEVIALNLHLKVYGFDPAKEFNRRLLEGMRARRQIKDYLLHDFE